MKLFDGGVALVTGAGSGIGRAAALLFAEHGAKVALTDLNAGQVEETAALVEEKGGKAIYTSGDITDVATIKQLADTTISTYGRLDYAFNNAGITHPVDHEWDDEAFQRSLDINLSSVFQCIKHEAPHMLKQGKGAIVNTASIAGIVGSMEPNLPGYTSSKHAVIGLTRTAAMKWARRGIRVNAVLPGVTRTKMVEDVMKLSPEVKQQLENMTPMGRIAEPREIAEAVIWLCSDKSSFVTGHGLVIDGGFSVL